MNLQVKRTVNNLKRNLYSKYVNGPHAQHNKDRIDWVLQHVYKKQISTYNRNEDKVLSCIANKGLMASSLVPMPILSEGGRLEHLYIADIVVGNTIIEVDGPQHLKHLEYDSLRDEQTSSLGYTTIRIPTDDLSTETINSYLMNL